MKRGLALLAALQALLVSGYLAIEASRRVTAPFPFETLDEPAPPLLWERAGGREPLPGGVVVVHFWATWCAPCRTELPSLLEAAEAEGVRLLAITDEPWPAVEAFLGTPVSEAVVRDPTGSAASAWRVSGLPDTFLVEDGRLRARVGGPRDWSIPTARRFFQPQREKAPSPRRARPMP